jgi:hypothetical protein
VTTYRARHDRGALRRDLDGLLGADGWRARGEVHVLGADHPVVRTRVALAADAEQIWRHLVVDVVTSMGGWNDAYLGGAVLGDDGAGVRRLITRARLPRPFADREDDFEQHAFVDDEGVFWELSRVSPEPTPPAPGHAPGRVLLAAKQIRPVGDGCIVDILWHYQLGGVLDLLPRAVRERALAGNLRHECERLTARFGAGRP